MTDKNPDIDNIIKQAYDFGYKNGDFIARLFILSFFEQQKANHDELTGLLNRNGLNNQTKNITLSDYAIIFCDVNNFKKINDLFGHDKGDKFLRDFGQKLLTHYREDDLVARLGGDEFVILVNLQQRQQDTAKKIDNNNKIQIIEKRFIQLITELIKNQPQDYQDHNLGIAFGVVMPEANENIYDVLIRADKLMYGNKQQSKDA